MFYRSLCWATFLITTFSSAFGQSSTALIKQNPRAQYEILKTVAFSSNLGRPDPRDKTPNIFLCGGEMAPGLTSDTLTANLIHLAYQVYKASQYLTSTGYPRSIWQSHLANYESAHLLRIINGQDFSSDADDPDIKILMQQLNDYRRKAPLLEITWVPCGGPGLPNIEIKTVPAGGEIWVIPVLMHTLCAKQQLNPDDRKQCNYGEDYSDGDEIQPPSGQHRYVVTWPGGLRKKGTVSFEKIGSVWTIR